MNKTKTPVPWAEFLKKNSMAAFIILGLAAGLILLVISVIPQPDRSETASKSNTGNAQIHMETEYIENKLAALIGKLDGVAEVSVMVTLDSSSEYIYASYQSVKENTSGGSKDAQKEITLAPDGNGAQIPVLVKEIIPKIRGVAIVCRNSSGSGAELDIINLAATALGVPTNKVYVTNTH